MASQSRAPLVQCSRVSSAAGTRSSRRCTLASLFGLPLGRRIDLVSPRHRCVPRAKPDWIIATEAKTGVVAKPAAPVAKQAVEAPKPVAKHCAGRYRDAEKRKAYMRTYMRDYQRKRGASS